MRSKTQTKGSLFSLISLPAVKNFIIILGVVVALLVGFFTLHAGVEPGSEPGSGLSIEPGRFALLSSGGVAVAAVDPENLEVSFQPEVLVYDKNFELILSANLSTISPYEREHVQRLLNVCDLLLVNENTSIYRLDK